MKTGHWKYINHWRRQQAREREAAELVCIGLIIIVLKPGETLVQSDHMVMIIIMTEESIFVVTLLPCLSKHLLAATRHTPAPYQCRRLL